MLYMGFKVVVVRSLRCILTRPPRIVLFSPSSALIAAHAPRFRELTIHHFNPSKFIAGKVTLPAALVFSN